MRLVIVCLLLVGSLAGCGGDDEPAPVDAVELPADLCDAVPTEVVDRWSLEPEDRSADGDDDRRRASCTMSGTTDDGTVDLAVSMVSFGGPSNAAVRTRVADALAVLCDQLETSAGGAAVTREDTRCSTESGAGGGEVTEISRSVPSQGVVTVTMRATGLQAQLVGAEVVAVSGTLANADPADLS